MEGRLSNRIIIIIIIINRKTAKSNVCQMGHDFDRSKVKKIVFSLGTVHALCVHKVVFLSENKNGPIMFGTLYYNLNYFLNVCWKLFCTCT